MNYQWYPGHMTRARRMMEEDLRLVDLVIEILDARIPVSGRNPDIDTIAKGKQRLVILCKSDLADPAATARAVAAAGHRGQEAIALDARMKKSNQQVLQAVQRATVQKRERDERRGMRNRPVRAMVCGIPNAGKSTFINSMAGRASARTGNRPGVTKGRQWISFPGMELLDTPGILWPKFDDREVGVRLALVGSIRDEILDEEELAVCLLGILDADYPGLVGRRYYGENTPDQSRGGPPGQSGEEAPAAAGDPVSVHADMVGAGSARGSRELSRLAVRRNLLRTGAQPDTARAARMLLEDFRSGRLGRITLDHI